MSGHNGPSRRMTIAWVMAAAASPLALAGCGPQTDASGWSDLEPEPITQGAYGGDPDLMAPSAPWPLTLTEAQRTLLRTCADMILPQDAHSPSAGALHVDAFIDEWVSAPYPRCQDDRKLILSGLRWLDRESQSRARVDFAAATDAQRRAIFDDIAFKDRVKAGYDKPAQFFGRLRGLVMAGFYTMPEGMADLGFVGNSPIMGAYPGPSTEAMAHLREQLTALRLDLPH